MLQHGYNSLDSSPFIEGSLFIILRILMNLPDGCKIGMVVTPNFINYSVSVPLRVLRVSVLQKILFINLTGKV